ncbi:hypothetical protein [uncultured Roseobacter sp.]|uniref:hypothetical protein n=1 Tax=uncultured Roseobacter sp. TaxID=114847 RepID=UPI00263738DD|nr:hypothetical protein [uncultured Roseobacter sp.]
MTRLWDNRHPSAIIETAPSDNGQTDQMLDALKVVGCGQIDAFHLGNGPPPCYGFSQRGQGISRQMNFFWKSCKKAQSFGCDCHVFRHNALAGNEEHALQVCLSLALSACVLWGWI